MMWINFDRHTNQYVMCGALRHPNYQFNIIYELGMGICPINCHDRSKSIFMSRNDIWRSLLDQFFSFFKYTEKKIYIYGSFGIYHSLWHNVTVWHSLFNTKRYQPGRAHLSHSVENFQFTWDTVNEIKVKKCAPFKYISNQC